MMYFHSLINKVGLLCTWPPLPTSILLQYTLTNFIVIEMLSRTTQGLNRAAKIPQQQHYMDLLSSGNFSLFLKYPTDLRQWSSRALRLATWSNSLCENIRAHLRYIITNALNPIKGSSFLAFYLAILNCDILNKRLMIRLLHRTH